MTAPDLVHDRTFIDWLTVTHRDGDVLKKCLRSPVAFLLTPYSGCYDPGMTHGMGVACLAVLCAALAACDGPPQDEHEKAADTAVVQDAQAPRTPEEQGYAEAREALAAGKPSIRFFGFPDFSAGDMEPETGLPYQGEGCEITDEGLERIDAYNAEIRRALDAGELDGLHLRHKATNLAAVLARFAADPGREVTTKSGPIDAPGGRFAVEAALDPETEELNLYVLDKRSGSRRALYWFECERARVLFADDGETLFLYGAESGVVQTHDLPTALFMQGWEVEPEDDETEEADDE